MKNYLQIPKLVLSLEKDDKKNTSGMQMRVWFLNNNTTVLVRFFQHNPDSHKKLWSGERTNGQVHDHVLNLLYEKSIINNTDNWDYNIDEIHKLSEQDEFEEKKQCLYFAWSVKFKFLHF